jgi:hypothetical protein
MEPRIPWPDENDDLDDEEDELVFSLNIPVREPTIFEMMMLLHFFFGYGGSGFGTRGTNLLETIASLDFPDTAEAYLVWMRLRDH